MKKGLACGFGVGSREISRPTRRWHVVPLALRRKRGGFATLSHFYLLGGFNRLLVVRSPHCRRLGCKVTSCRDSYDFTAVI